MGKLLEPDDSDIEKMIFKSGAASEEEFENSLLEDWDIVKCCVCGKKLNIFDGVVSIEDKLAHRECLSGRIRRC